MAIVSGWFPQTRYIRTPQGVFVGLPSLRMMAALFLPFLALCGGLALLHKLTWAGSIPGLLMGGILLERSIRYRHLPGAPVATLEGDVLRLFMPNHFGRETRINLDDVQTLSFYGPALSEFAVIRRDGRQERYYPAWTPSTRAEIKRFLEERLSDRIEVREGERPGLFDDIRGSYEP